MKQGPLTKPVHRNTSIINDKIDPFRMFLFQILAEGADAAGGGDVELMVLDLCEPAISSESDSFLELRIIVNGFEGFFSSFLVSRCEVDEEQAAAER